MKFKLPFVGEVYIGKPNVVKEIVKEIKATEKTIGGSFLDFNYNTNLSDEKRVSSKVLEANRGWVYRNTDVIAKEVGSIEFELFTIRVVGKDIVYNPILQHPILDILDRFNEFTDSSSGFYTTEAHRLLSGDSFWYLSGSGPNVTGIYILQPDKVEIKFGDIAEGQRIISGYEFRDTVNGDPIERTYDAEEIIHHKVPNPKNPYRGLGKVEAAADAIDTDTFAIEANKQLFRRGLISNFILTTPNKLTTEQLKQLHAEFKSSFQGVENAFKVPIFGSDLKPETVQMTNKDMQFLDQQEWLRDKITAIWGNNKAVVGVTDDVNRANAEESTLQWKRTTVRNEMKAICDTLNEFLVPRYGTNLVLGFKDPVPEDEGAKVEKASKLKNSDLITLNEAREIINYDPVQGGDEFSFQRSERQARQIPAPLKYVNLTKVLRRAGVYKKQEEYEKLLSIAKPIATRIVKNRKKTDEPQRESLDFSNEKVWEFHNKQIHIVEVQEEIFQAKCEQYILGMVERALGSVPEEVALMQNKALIDEEQEIVQATLDFTPILNEVAILSGQQALSFIGETEPYLAMDIRKTIEASVRKFAKSIIDTDREKMIDILAQGIADGTSIPKIRNQILEEFSTFSKMQAERVTRTEVIRTSNLASMDAWAQVGVETKQWLTAMDDRVDPLCAYMNGKVINIKKNYFDKGQTLEVGDHKTNFDYGSVKAPPLHPNCRCTLLPVLNTENAFDAEQYVRIKGLEKDKADLEAKIDKRTKKYKEITAQNLELEAYVKELEDYLDEA